MRQLSRCILAFAIVPTALVFSVGPVSKYIEVNLSSLRAGEFIGLFVPLVTIILYWLLFQLGKKEWPTLYESIIFLILAAGLAEGYGMNLSTNAVGLRLQAMKTSEAYTVTHFFDEFLSHYLWHFAMIGLSTLLLYRQWQHPFNREKVSLKPESFAGIIYGTFFFGCIIEGGTIIIGFPYALLVTLFGLIWGRKKLRQQPLLAFFFVANAVALILFAGWRFYRDGFPQPTELGVAKFLTDY